MNCSRPVLIGSSVTLAVVCLGSLLWIFRPRLPAAATSSPEASLKASQSTSAAPVSDSNSTLVYAHNLLLRKGPDFRIYIRFLRGEMMRTRRQINPSFDDPDSFVLNIRKGVIRANIGDISNYLNASSPPDAPLKNISIEPFGEQIKLHGTVHKIFTIPIELIGTLSPIADGRIRFHMTKLEVVRIPLKGLLRSFHVGLSNLVPAVNIPGVEIVDNDILFDTQMLLPPPHIHGQLTSVRIKIPDIEANYGDAVDDESQLARWHNFLRLSGGTIDFGKITMHHVDITMIDASQDAWFDLDLVNYQAQLVNGYTRMTPQAGLEIFMPDLEQRAPKKASQAITLEWLKDRNRSLPLDVPVK